EKWLGSDWYALSAQSRWMALSSEIELRLAGASSGPTELGAVLVWHATAPREPASNRYRVENRMESSGSSGRSGTKHAACRNVTHGQRYSWPAEPRSLCHPEGTASPVPTSERLTGQEPQAALERG